MKICKVCGIELKDDNKIKDRRLCKNCYSEYANKSHIQNGKYKLSSWISQILANHKQKDFIIDIATLELAERWKDIKNCQLCGVKLDWSYGKGNSKNNSPSIDRINNDKIMTIDNVQLLCNRCNRIKSDNTTKEFIKHCKKIYRYNENINYDIKGTQIRFV